MVGIGYGICIAASFLGGLVLFIGQQCIVPSVYCFMLGFLLYVGMRHKRGARFLLLMLGVTAPLCGIYLLWEEQSLAARISAGVLLRSALGLMIVGTILLAVAWRIPSPDDPDGTTGH